MAIQLFVKDLGSDFKILTMEEVRNRKEGLHFDSAEPLSICYVGPCVDGSREICYNNGDGCVSCGFTTEGCN